MDTQSKSMGLSRFIILIPHKDALRALEEYRQRLFSSGVVSAHSFPMAAPLAEVSRPLSLKELKELSRNIRSLTEKTNGMISFSYSVVAAKSRPAPLLNPKHFGFSFFGFRLNLSIDETTFPNTVKNIRIFTQPVLCAALEKSLENEEFTGIIGDSGAKPVYFRAASLANLAIHQLDESDYSFEWRKYESVWLPAWKTGSRIK